MPGLLWFRRVGLFFFLSVLLSPRDDQHVFLAEGTVERCQANCNDPVNRLSGPTRHIDPLGRQKHPYAITDFPTDNPAFCMLGCSYFFGPYDFNVQNDIVIDTSVDKPTNQSCVEKCQYAYRYQVTTGFSDVIEESLSACYDGCDIALQTCQAGFYCIGGWMLPCPPGEWRNESMGVPAVLSCIPCPFGRYRSLAKGKNPDECSLCPRGKYADKEGTTNTAECIRCPAGKFADEEGMRICKCIVADALNPDSCELNFRNPDDTIKKQYFIPEGGEGYITDYFRESVPYIGRW